METRTPDAREAGHVPVLAGPALDMLRVRAGGLYVDATAGEGGHAALIIERMTGASGRFIAMDRDAGAVARTTRRLARFPQAAIVHRNFAELEEVFSELGLGQADGILFDFGLSSVQLDDETRGFTFEREGPLDMRMDRSRGMTAQALLEQTSESEIARMLKVYGDVGPAKRIAAAIVRRRGAQRLRTTRDLAEAVAEALPFTSDTPEETRTVFQAVRIAVNEELANIERGVRSAIGHLGTGGRIVCISFHSGEDRIVKNLFREMSHPCRLLAPDGRVRETVAPSLEILTPKPLRADEAELAANSRARSARLRAAEKLPAPKGAA